MDYNYRPDEKFAENNNSAAPLAESRAWGSPTPRKMEGNRAWTDCTCPYCGKELELQVKLQSGRDMKPIVRDIDDIPDNVLISL